MTCVEARNPETLHALQSESRNALKATSLQERTVQTSRAVCPRRLCKHADKTVRSNSRSIELTEDRSLHRRAAAVIAKTRSCNRHRLLSPVTFAAVGAEQLFELQNNPAGDDGLGFCVARQRLAFQAEGRRLLP